MSKTDEQMFEEVDEFTNDDFEELGDTNPYLEEVVDGGELLVPVEDDNEGRERDEQSGGDDEEVSYGNVGYGDGKDEGGEETDEDEDGEGNRARKPRAALKGYELSDEDGYEYEGEAGEEDRGENKKKKSRPHMNRGGSGERRRSNKNSPGTGSRTSPKSRAKGAEEVIIGEEEMLVTIRKLTKQNENLKRQLIDLNSILDSQLQQKGVKMQSMVSKREHASDREIKSLMRQTENYKRENESLKKLVVDSEVSDRVVRLENVIRDKQRRIKALLDEKKGMENQVREQSKALEKLSDGPDTKIQQISSDIRWLKEANRKLKDKTLLQQDVIDKQNAQLLKLKNRCDKLKRALEEHNLVGNTVEELRKLRAEVEEANALVETTKKASEVEQRSLSSKLRRAITESQAKDTEVKGLGDDIVSLKEQLEEKDKEMRQAVLQAKQDARGGHSSRPIAITKQRSGSSTAVAQEQPKSSSTDKTTAKKPARKAPAVTKAVLSKEKQAPKIATKTRTEDKEKDPDGEFKSDFEEVPEKTQKKERNGAAPAPALAPSPAENVSVFKPSL